MIDQTGSIISLTECESKFDFKINLLQYFSICQSLRCAFNLNFQDLSHRICEPFVMPYISPIVRDKKGCKSIYKLLIGKKDSVKTIATKWGKNSFNLLDHTKIPDFNKMIFRFTMDIRLKYFQYKVFNRIVFLNDVLFKLNITNTEFCTFCNTGKETVEHFFYFCTFSRNIWSKVEKWISSPMFTLNLTPQSILFGYKEKRNDALNCITVLVKQQLFYSRLNKTLPDFKKIQKVLRTYYLDECYVCDIIGKRKEFVLKWSMLKHLFE